MRLIWATRGRDWGFRFLRTGGFGDPLPIYGEVFAGVDDQEQFCRHVGDKVALRFLDPESRKDAAGRVIPHDFVVFPPEAHDLNSVADGVERVWPEVEMIFGRAWDSSEAPSSTE